MRDNWKLWVTGAVLLVMLGLCVQRFRTSFQDQPPEWMHLQERVSPELPEVIRAQFVGLRKEIEEEAAGLKLPVQSLQMVEILPGGKEIRIWSLQKYINAGSNPLSNLEVLRWLNDDSPVGYYTLDGEALPFMLKHHPARPKTAFGVIQLKTPLAGGETRMVVYVEKQPNNLKPNAEGVLAYHFARLRNPEASVQVEGLLLPTGYKLVGYNPTSGSYTPVTGPPMVAWFNTRVPATDLSPTALFKER